MSVIPALIPVRDSEPLISLESIYPCPLSMSSANHRLPFIPLVTSAQVQIMGRADFLLSTATACSCLKNVDRSGGIVGRPSCPLCKAYEKWVVPFVSRKFIRLELFSKEDWLWNLVPIGMNSSTIVTIDRVPLEKGPPQVKIGSTISLVCPKKNIMKEEGYDMRGENMDFRVAMVLISRDDSKNPSLNGTESKTTENISVEQSGLCRSSHMRRQDSDTSLLDIHRDSSLKQRPGTGSPVTTPDQKSKLYETEHLDLPTTRSFKQLTSDMGKVMEDVGCCKSNELQTEECISIIQPPTAETIIDLDGDEEDNDDERVLPIASTSSPASNIFLLAMGRGMSTSRVYSLKKYAEKNIIDCKILSSFDPQQPPDIIVVDSTLSVANVSSGLGFTTMDDFACFLEKNATHVVIPEWINKCARATDQPTLALCWPGMFEIARGKRCTIPTTGWVKRSKRTSEIMPLTFVKASESKVPFVQNAMKRRKETLDCILTESNVARFQSVSTTYPMNMILSSLMDQISLLYAESPIEPNDEWRSYSYKVISGRLRHLEFEVQNLPATLRRLGAIKGFGTSVMRWIGEYLNHNKCSLIQELESSDIRSSVRRLNHIWGVGPRKALSLVHLGYKNIEDIRAALKNGKLNLQANIRIGVDCYEDFLETMERDEVAIIGKIVEETILERFPEAHVCIMGSYRRGKSQCGDVDVLITHPQYIEAVPAGVIDWLVESLRLRGHISHHLTKVNIFHTNEDISNIESYDEDILDLGCSVSYMGVFLSPVHANKKRRIDIKFYPLNEQATAMLYFTGSSYFNRSIRLYAKTVKKLHLDDHGIFHRSSTFGSEKKINVKTERDIFDLLGLEYKEPFERDSFDAVKIKGSSEPLFLSVTESEFD